MVILRRSLLSVALASPAFAAPADASRAERSMGSPQARSDRRRVLLAHLSALRRVRPRVAAGAQGQMDRTRQAALGVLRLPQRQGRAAGCDGGALSAAGALRALHRHAVRHPGPLGVRRGQRARCAVAAGGGCGHGSRPHSTGRLPTSELQDWIVQRALDAEQRWHVDATPSFVINGKLYTGAMSAGEFAIISGALAEDLYCPCSFAACASPGSRASPNRSAWKSMRVSPASSGRTAAASPMWSRRCAGRWGSRAPARCAPARWTT